MHFSTALLSTLSLASVGLSAPLAVNTSREFILETQLLPGHPASKAKFGGLWLEAYHTGAGLNDAVFTTTKANAAKGFFNKTTPASSYSNLEFDLGGAVPYAVQITGGSSYDAWGPVTINGGELDNYGGYFINGTGLQFTSTTTGSQSLTEFGGWLACEWAHGAPQLFQKFNFDNLKIPCSCANVHLIPHYI